MSSELKYWFLRDHKLFRNLSFSEIDTLCILNRFKQSKKHEIVELPYSEKPRIYFLKKGILKLIRIDEMGDEVIIDILHKGDLFGELDFGEDKKSELESIKVLSSEAIICSFYKQDLEKLFLRKPEFALSYIKFIGFNFKKIKNSYQNIFYKDARTRLMLFIHSILEKEEVISGPYTLPNYLTQKDIAQLVCTTRQTVINLFNELEKEGLLKYSQKEIQIPDVSKFKNFT